MSKPVALADAPALDTSDARHREMEALGVVENIVGSIIGSVRRELKAAEKGQTVKPPTAAGYTKILIADLHARGFSIERKERQP